MPPTSTHPLFKSPPVQQSSIPSSANQQQITAPTLNYSNTDAPKIGFYQAQQNTSTKNSSSNPWEREEREKEIEMRREQIRQWRDQQIVELSLLPSRSQQQEEQLKALVLERDFERRAQEEENEEDNEAQYQKNAGGIQEVLRLQSGTMSNNVQPSQISAPATRLKQVDIRTTPTNISPETTPSNINDVLPPMVQPKGILKSTNTYNSNPSSPSKHAKTTSFATKVDAKKQNLTEITINNTNANQMLTQLNKEMSEITLEYQAEDTNGPLPPPPPERGSSFAVMHQQKVRSSGTFQKLSFNDQQLMNNNNYNNKYVPSNDHSPMMMSPTGGQSPFTAHQIQQQMNLINNNVNSFAFQRDNKRVSFHDHENNNVEILTEQSELSIIREDPNVS